MKAKRLLRLIFPALLWLFASGCATEALWNKTHWDAAKRADDEPRLQIFSADEKGDFLVVYEEFSERTITAVSSAARLRESHQMT